MSYARSEHHFTLYYYDQAGNLIKPYLEGVVPFVDQSHLDQIASARAGDPGKQELFPDHKMVTYYQYNTRNQVTKQYMPDHDGESYFWYDRLGQLLVSQNPRQAQAARFSYSLYDNLSRVVESGEMEPINPGIPGQFSAASPHTIMRNFSWINDWFFGAKGYEVTSSVYDNQVHPTNHSSLQRVGKNLNKRIGTVAYFNERPNNSNGMDVNASGTIESLGENSNRETAFNSADYLLHYSYDIHGNVADYYQEAMDTDFESENNINGNLAGIEMRLAHINYEYDLLSGNVKRVNYQPGADRNSDRFIHRYEYDADNRITRVFTSYDGRIWDEDARYFYYPHGPLARMELGQQNVQGVDYVYTLQGWLKAVNGLGYTSGSGDFRCW